jgi:hypothetical protein
LTKELVEEMHARTGIPVKQGYGLTEYRVLLKSMLMTELHPPLMPKNGNIGDLISARLANFAQIWKPNLSMRTETKFRMAKMGNFG